MTKRNKERVYESYEGIVHRFDDTRTKTLKVLLRKVRDPECGEATVWVSKKIDK